VTKLLSPGESIEEYPHSSLLIWLGSFDSGLLVILDHRAKLPTKFRVSWCP
jgi:hypothetical protein